MALQNVYKIQKNKIKYVRPWQHPDYDKGNEDNKKLVVLPERFFVPAMQAHLAGTEWADPHNTNEWQRFAKNEDYVAD